MTTQNQGNVSVTPPGDRTSPRTKLMPRIEELFTPKGQRAIYIISILRQLRDEGIPCDDAQHNLTQMILDLNQYAMDEMCPELLPLERYGVRELETVADAATDESSATQTPAA